MDNQQKTLVNLLNPSFPFPFADKEYMVKKANIEQVQQYQLKVEELSAKKDIPVVVRDLDAVSYSVYLILHKADPTVTQDFVKENMPGGINIMQLLSELGFIDPQKAKMVMEMQEKLISGNSLRTLPTEQDGLQPKSESLPLTS